jgi:hypothetical protein
MNVSSLGWFIQAFYFQESSNKEQLLTLIISRPCASRTDASKGRLERSSCTETGVRGQGRIQLPKPTSGNREALLRRLFGVRKTASQVLDEATSSVDQSRTLRVQNDTFKTNGHSL